MKDKLPAEKRRFELYRLISSGECLSRKEIAEKLDVDVRIVNYDLNKLKDIWGVVAEYNPHERKYELKNPGTMEEVEYKDEEFQPKVKESDLRERDISLILASLVESRNFMPSEIGNIITKLLKMLPKQEANKLEKLHHLDGKRSMEDREIFDYIEKVRQAIKEDKKIEFRYENYDGIIKSHTVSPYCFACELGKYYVIGKPDGKDKFFHFRMDRCKSIKILHSQKSIIDKNFNINEYLQKTWTMYGGEEIEVLVKFKYNALKVVRERNMQCGKLLKIVDGKYFYYKFIVNGTIGIKLWLLGMGDQAKVLRPRSLRKEIKENIKNMCKIYDIK